MRAVHLKKEITKGCKQNKMIIIDNHKNKTFMYKNISLSNFRHNIDSLCIVYGFELNYSLQTRHVMHLFN